MSQEYRRIMEIRRDLSAYLLHCTRRKEGHKAFDVLKTILRDGFLKATLAPYTIRRNGRTETRKAVRGPNRAVCFTEQPLGFFWESVKISRLFKERYTAFAVAIRKDELFNYGGRPVIYTDEEVLGKKLSPEECENCNYLPDAWVYKGGLPLDLQYLWVHYNPTAIWDPSRKHEVDFTHEREWRARPRAVLNRNLGLSQQDAEIAVPLQLLTKDSRWTPVGPRPEERPRFAILVDSEERKRELSDWIARTADQISERGSYWERYANVLPKAPILSFEEIINDTLVPLARLARLEEFINDDFTRITFSL